MNTPPKRTKENAPRGYLKTNSKRILDIIAGQPEQNATKAYKEIHPNAADVTARSNAYQLLQKPAAQIYLQKHVNRAKETIVELMTSSEKDEIRLRSAIDVLDREHGKAVQRSEVHNTGIRINIDMTQSDPETASD